MQMRLFFGFLFLLLSIRTEAQVKRGLTPMDIASLKSIASAAWSADGSSIAYTLRIQAVLGDDHSKATHAMTLRFGR